jgi:large subunit ribosomal protein L25
MADVTLVAETGRTHGSAPSRRLRGEGRVPGVVYGRGGDPITLSVDRRELRHALAGPAGVNALITLQVEGRKELTLIKELQRHPVRRTVTHIDFIRVDVHEAVTVEVPIHLEGEARAVLQRDGLVDPALNHITITATPDHIPDAIVVDVSGMQIGDVIRVRDLVLPANATTPLDLDTPVVTAEFTGAGLAAEGEEAEGEPAEGGAEAPAEGTDAGEGAEG